MRRSRPLLRSVPLVVASLLVAALASAQTAPRADSPTLEGPTLDRTFGIRVVGGGDRVASLVGALGGVRVDDLEKGTLAREIRHPDVRRYLRRGDFILRIRVEGVDPEPRPGRDTIDTIEAFVAACDRVRTTIAKQPGGKGTLLFDVFTQAGYNVEDWTTITYEAELDLEALASGTEESVDE